MAEQENKGKVLRQKMIGFMYLIFIVLTIIYIPSDFIDSISSINTSLEKTAQKIDKMNGYSLSLIESALENDTSINVDEEMNKLKNINSITNAIFLEIERAKDSVINVAGGFQENGFYENASASQYTDELFYDQGLASNIKNRLIRFKSAVKNAEIEINHAYLDSIIPTDALIVGSDDKANTWEAFYFKKKPLAVAVSLLSKFQSDLRSVELMLTESHIRDITERYKLILIDTTKIEDDTLIDKKVFEELLRKAQEPKAKPEQKRPPQQAKIENTDLAVLYIGVYNPLQIAHPKVGYNVLTAEISEGEIYKKDSTFYAKVNKPGVVEIKVIAQGNESGVKQFNAKFLPKPSLTVADRDGGKIASKIFRVQKKVDVLSEVKTAKDEYQVKSFSLMKISSDGKILKSGVNNGAFFNSSTIDLIKTSERNDRYIFEDIEVEGPDGKKISLSSLMFKVI